MLNGDLFLSSKIAAVMALGDQAIMKGKRQLRPSPDDVRVIGISEYKEASACLVEAFKEDLAIRYCIDTPDMAHHSAERKQKLYVENMDYVTAAHVYNGLVTTIGSNYASVAIWYQRQSQFSTRSDTYHSPGFLRAKTSRTGAPYSAAVSGGCITNSPPKAANASSPSSSPSCTTRNAMCSASETPKAITSSTSVRDLVSSAKATEGR